MAREKTGTDFSVDLGPVTVAVEEGVAGDIDSNMSMGVGASAIAFYDGNGDLTNYYYYESDLGMSSSMKDVITGFVENTLGDYHIIGSDDPSLDWTDFAFTNDTFSFLIEFAGQLTAWTDYRGQPYYNHAYKSFTMSKGHWFNTDLSGLKYLAAFALAILLAVCLAFIISTVGAAGTATALSGTALFLAMQNLRDNNA
ncbi:hypothetical protein GLW08_21505 [Pontibacillus yanchengensis]|uniref:Uncharacterized protein n=2 Tax=Pontibacillus yanchengensis TaxID=462910 RepID=A0ACC7VLJ8_9BACI|nr:hypothetical protein [Pontibacillus yanchengensis]MYL36131.1 hypothetical protein [Pontibacillus yanchengensis]MYL55881.1 hypothetical protein [Pontibacillus yanchengensis]